MTDQLALSETIHRLGPWFHNLTLGGVRTAPDHFLGDFPSNFFQHFANTLPKDLDGWSVLDVGCNAGFYAFEMHRRGARDIVGIDASPQYLAQARFAASVLSAPVQFKDLSVYDVASLGRRFDLVLFLGVFYHLRYPLLALDLLRRVAVGRLLVFQSMQRGPQAISGVTPDYDFYDETPFQNEAFPRLHLIEHRYAHDETNWWVPNRAAVEALLRVSGFEIVSHPTVEVYICRPSGDDLVDLPHAFQEVARG